MKDENNFARICEEEDMLAIRIGYTAVTMSLRRSPPDIYFYFILFMFFVYLLSKTC